MCVLHLSEGQRAVSTVDLTPIWKPSEALVKIKLLDAWPLDVGRSGCRCDTPGYSRPQTCYHLRPLRLRFHCSTPIRKSGQGTGTYVSLNLHSWLLTKEYSIQELMQWNAMLFQLHYGCTIYRPLYFHISNSDEIITQWIMTKKLLNFSICYGKIMTSQCIQ